MECIIGGINALQRTGLKPHPHTPVWNDGQYHMQQGFIVWCPKRAMLFIHDTNTRPAHCGCGKTLK